MLRCLSAHPRLHLHLKPGLEKVCPGAASRSASSVGEGLEAVLDKRVAADCEAEGRAAVCAGSDAQLVQVSQGREEGDARRKGDDLGARAQHDLQAGGGGEQQG